MHSVSRQESRTQMAKNCHYHPGERLTHICLDSKCLLPLCQKCLPIHAEQLSHQYQNEQLGHHNRSGLTSIALHQQNIVKMDAAKDRAISEIRCQMQANHQFSVQFDRLRAELLKAVQNILKEIQSSFKEQIVGKVRSEDEEVARINKIQAGNIAELIFHYEDIAHRPKSQWKIESCIESDKIKQLFSSCINVQKCKQKNVEQKQDMSYLNRSPQFLLKIDEINNSRLNQTVQSNESIVHDKILQNSRYTEHHELVQSVQPASNEISRQFTRKNRPGIFVTTSPKPQSKLRYGSQSVELRRSDNSLDAQNSFVPTTHKRTIVENAQILNPNFVNGLLSPSMLTSGRQSQLAQFSREISVSNSEGKLKASLPKKVIFYKQSPKSKTTRNSEDQVNLASKLFQSSSRRLKIKSDQKRLTPCPKTEQIDASFTPKSCNKELKNIINRRDLASNSSSRLTLKRTQINSRVPASGQKMLFQNQCLNPQEMRDLIMRRKNAGSGGNYSNIGLDCSSATERIFLEKLNLA